MTNAISEWDSLMELKGSQTEKNLLAAFAGGSQASNRYTVTEGNSQTEGIERAPCQSNDVGWDESEDVELFLFQYLT